MVKKYLENCAKISVKYPDNNESLRFYHYRQIENGIEVKRVLSGYRDFDALFLDDNS
jgi:hypothetical protein